MKKLKIVILAIAVIASVSGAFASKKQKGGQYFYVIAGTTSNAVTDYETSTDQTAPSSTCQTGNYTYVCQILTSASADYYEAGDVIPRTEASIVKSYSGK